MTLGRQPHRSLRTNPKLVLNQSDRAPGFIASKNLAENHEPQGALPVKKDGPIYQDLNRLTHAKIRFGFQEHTATAEVLDPGLHSISRQDALGLSSEWISRTSPTFGLGQSWAWESSDPSGVG